jgi:uncharacterized protein (TIGR02246 family)
MKRQVQLVCGLLSTALLIGVAPSTVHTQGTPDAEFKKIAAAFSDAWAKGDAKSIAALHTKGAVRMAGNGQPPIVGTAAIEKTFTDAFAGALKGTTLTITPNQYMRVSADTYVGEGTYQLSGGTPQPGAPTSGQYMNTMVREGGRWLIAASAVMPITPPK